MKMTTQYFSALSFIVIVSMASCNTPAENVTNAQENVIQANNNLDSANKAYEEDMANYRKEAADRIAANDSSIAQFKARIANEKKADRADYQKKLDVLDAKNSDLKKRMDDYKAEGKSNWQIFRAEFNHDMDALGTSIKNMGSNKN